MCVHLCACTCAYITGLTYDGHHEIWYEVARGKRLPALSLSAGAAHSTEHRGEKIRTVWYGWARACPRKGQQLGGL